MKSPVLKVKNVYRNYIDEDNLNSTVHALHDISFEVYSGEFVSIIGSSGCGKTTLLRLIGGLDAPQSGELLINGERITRPDPKRGYIFQQGNLFPWLTVEENIASGLKARHVFRKERHRIPDFVRMIGLEGFEKSYPHEISGGMSQRVAIARALINDPEILLLDEPMGALDSFTRADMQEKLLEIRSRSNATMLLVTHDIDEAIYLSDRIIIMTPRPGRISDIMQITFPHPRHRGGGEFMSIRRELLDLFKMASAKPEPEYVI